MGTDEKEIAPVKPKRGQLWIAIGVALGCLVIVTTALTVIDLTRGGPPGACFYRALMSGRVWIPNKRLAAGLPRDMSLEAPHRPFSEIALRVGDYSFAFPRTARRVTLIWRTWINSPPSNMVRRVAFSLAGARAATRTERARFMSFTKLRPYARAPSGMVEVGDWNGGYFLVPSAAKTITVEVRRSAGHLGPSDISVALPGAILTWDPVSHWSDPRYFFQKVLMHVWPVKDPIKPIGRVLARWGISQSNAAKLIRTIIRQKLATHTDLQLLRGALRATTTRIKDEKSINKAIWMTLELELFLYSRAGPVIWVHPGDGRCLCFVSGPLGAEALVFNAAGQATSVGVVLYRGPRWGPPSVWFSWLRMLKSGAVPFFSQPAPPWFAQRGGARQITIGPGAP